MSAYSDWKCEALSDREYRDECIKENRRERFYDMLDAAECGEPWEEEDEEILDECD